ncbi:uncharacterized protein LOC112021116 [Quercus suber]|uniref:uncharacterized protein LOC112021116 n=1 Tax=Quercus suber TaxID=58331 RepID=UPI000CE17870|nr:uncharacterized protein LOC112021116 [Quercus suber]
MDEKAEEAKCEDLEKIVIGDNPEKFFQVGAQLPPQEKEELVEFSGGILTCKFLGHMVTHRGLEVNPDQLKEYLSWPPVMFRLKVDEVLFDNGVQKPVYYVSKSLHETAVRYPPLEKAILAVVHATSNQRGFGVGLVLISPEKITIEKSLRLGFLATNNEVEYEVLLVGMIIVQKMEGKAVEIFSDSRLVVGQVKGELEARDVRMQEYLSQVRHLRSGFESFNLLHIPRSGNTHANSLATLATSSAQDLPRVILVKELCNPTEMKREMVHIHQIRVKPCWMDSIMLFLKEDILLEEKSEADKVRRKAPRFWLSKDQKLYKRSFSGLLLRDTTS